MKLYDSNWDVYAKFFHDLKSFFWFQPQDKCELRFDLKSQGFSNFAEYSSFWISGEGDNFRLHVYGYHGDAGDALTAYGGYHDNMQFSTPGHDNDVKSNYNCASEWKSGWWYKSCSKVNFNVRWGFINYQAWNTLPSRGKGLLRSLEMKFRIRGNLNRLVIRYL